MIQGIKSFIAQYSSFQVYLLAQNFCFNLCSSQAEHLLERESLAPFSGSQYFSARGAAYVIFVTQNIDKEWKMSHTYSD